MTEARYAQLTHPYTSESFVEWSDDFIDVYNDILVEKVFNEDTWRMWVQNLYLNGSFPSAPDDSEFADWRDWAAAFIKAQIE